MKMPSGKRLLVVSHDAGGAEIIAAWARRHAPQGFACVAEGPAQRVFASTDLSAIRMLSPDEALDQLAEFGTVLTGSSWSSDLEKVFVERGRAAGIRTVTYLDHWTDFRERFESGGRLTLPHEIWVGDEYAERIAKAAFPGEQIRNVGNFYLSEVAGQVRAASATRQDRSGGKRVLFVSEPLSAAAQRKYGDRSYFGYTEHEALAAFLEYARQNWWQVVESIRIRRHPAEATGKFSALVSARPIPVEECGDAPLVEDCAWADWIAGCQSMALVVGLLAGRQVFSAIPPGGRPSPIPYPGIMPLFQPKTEQREPTQGTTS